MFFLEHISVFIFNNVLFQADATSLAQQVLDKFVDLLSATGRDDRARTATQVARFVLLDRHPCTSVAVSVMWR